MVLGRTTSELLSSLCRHPILGVIVRLIPFRAMSETEGYQSIRLRLIKFLFPKTYKRIATLNINYANNLCKRAREGLSDGKNYKRGSAANN